MLTIQKESSLKIGIITDISSRYNIISEFISSKNLQKKLPVNIILTQAQCTIFWERAIGTSFTTYSVKKYSCSTTLIVTPQYINFLHFKKTSLYKSFLNSENIFIDLTVNDLPKEFLNDLLKLDAFIWFIDRKEILYSSKNQYISTFNLIRNKHFRIPSVAISDNTTISLNIQPKKHSYKMLFMNSSWIPNISLKLYRGINYLKECLICFNKRKCYLCERCKQPMCIQCLQSWFSREITRHFCPFCKKTPPVFLCNKIFTTNYPKRFIYIGELTEDVKERFKIEPLRSTELEIREQLLKVLSGEKNYLFLKKVNCYNYGMALNITNFIINTMNLSNKALDKIWDFIDVTSPSSPTIYIY